MSIALVVVLWYFEQYDSVGGALTGAFILVAMVAAGLIRQKGGEQYLAEAEQGPITWLRHVMAFLSCWSFASDKFPAPPEVVGLKVQPSGTPTVRSALLRIILIVPHAIVLGLLGIIFAICWIVAAIAILISGSYPEFVAKFIRGYLRWTARVLVYMASLVEEYPPFSFDTGDEAVLPEAPA